MQYCIPFDHKVFLLNMKGRDIMEATKREINIALKAMREAGYRNVRKSQLKKIPTEENDYIFVAMISNGFVAYYPHYDHTSRNDACVRFVPF